MPSKYRVTTDSGVFEVTVDDGPAVHGMEKLGGTAPGPAKPPNPIAPIAGSAHLPSESSLESGARAGYLAKYGMEPPENFGRGDVGTLMSTQMVPAMLTGPGAFATSLGAGYATRSGAKALGVPELGADIAGGLVSLATGGLYSKLLPGVFPQQLSKQSTAFLNLLPGKNYGDSANKFLSALSRVPEVTPFEPFRSSANVARTLRYGGPADPGFSPAPARAASGWKPPEGMLIPTEPKITPQAPTPFRPSPSIAARSRFGGPAEPDFSPAPPRSAGTWKPPEGMLVPTEAPPPEPVPFEPVRVNPNIMRLVSRKSTGYDTARGPLNRNIRPAVPLSQRQFGPSLESMLEDLKTGKVEPPSQPAAQPTTSPIQPVKSAAAPATQPPTAAPIPLTPPSPEGAATFLRPANVSSSYLRKVQEGGEVIARQSEAHDTALATELLKQNITPESIRAVLDKDPVGGMAALEAKCRDINQKLGLRNRPWGSDPASRGKKGGHLSETEGKMLKASDIMDRMSNLLGR